MTRRSYESAPSNYRSWRRAFGSLTWHAIFGLNRHGLPYLQNHSAIFSMPSHIKCFSQKITNREQLLKFALSFNDFKAGMHLCYNDAVFTGVFYSIYMSMMLDRELHV